MRSGASAIGNRGGAVAGLTQRAPQFDDGD
jgi:hypothetical protein